MGPRPVLALAVVGVMLLTACSATSGTPDDGAQRLEDALAFRLAEAASDIGLSVSAPDSAAASESFVVSAQAKVIDGGNVIGTTVQFDVDGADAGEPSLGCEPTSTGQRCMAPPRNGDMELGTISPRDPGTFDITLTPRPDASEVTVVATLTSQLNGLDTEPDPTNNVVTVTIPVVAGGPGSAAGPDGTVSPGGDVDRSDLYVEVSAPEPPVAPGAVIDVDLMIGNLRGVGAQDVSVSLELVGLAPDEMSSDCVATPTGVDCVVPPGPGPDPYAGLGDDPPDDTAISVFSLPVYVRTSLVVTAAPGDTASVTAVVTNRNDLDSDYDPANNTAVYTVAVG